MIIYNKISIFLQLMKICFIYPTSLLLLNLNADANILMVLYTLDEINLEKNFILVTKTKNVDSSIEILPVL